MNWKKYILVAGLLLVESAVGPSRLTSAGEAPAPRVAIDNFHFTPDRLEVAVGTTVTWVNHDDVPHTATSSNDPPAFDSKALDTDDHFSFTFTRPGVYRYYCKVHTHMTGTVVVK